MILFAYASFMDLDELSIHVPSVRKLCNAYIPGYEFCFNKSYGELSAVANIQPSRNGAAKVWGILIELEDVGNLIQKNPDWEEHMELIDVKCIDDAGTLYHAATLISKPHAINNYLFPYDWYKERIIALASEQGLPAEYISSLQMMEAKKDPDKNSDRTLPGL